MRHIGIFPTKCGAKEPQNPQNHRVDEAFCPPKGCPFAKVSLALVDPITDEVEIVCECAWSVGLVTEVEKFNRIKGALTDVPVGGGF